MKYTETLSNEKNVELVALAQNGNKTAMDTLISANMALVEYVAKKYEYAIPLEDAISEGVIALVDAISTFDSERNVKFSYYACTKIANQIKNAIPKYTPVKTKRYCRMTEDERTALYAVSLNEEDENGNELEDSVYNENESSLSEIIFHKEDIKTIYLAMEKVLDETERQVFQGLVIDDKTLQEMGRIIGCSHEHIRKINERAVAKIRQYMSC